jgi:endonuclease/exonuclease/phosphatase (EEP) superfamily protein YafD
MFPIWFLIAAIIGSPRRIFRQSENPDQSSPRNPFRRVNLIFSLICLVWVVFSECGDRTRSSTSNDFRFVFWNVARVVAGTDLVASRLKQFDAPLVALVEADKNHRVDTVEWQRQLPDYQVVSTHYGGLVAVRGTVISQQIHILGTGSWCEQFELRVDGDEFTLILVDICSDPTLSRRQPFEALSRLLHESRGRPVLIAGDFNTPDDSVWYASWRSHFREAFSERGSGYAATWPVPVPVLKLDQVWVNEFFNVSQCRHEWSAYSDHRPVVTDLSIRTLEQATSESSRTVR